MCESFLDTCNISEERLIVGNHESLLIFGSDAQEKLRRFSKTVAEIMMRSNDDLEASINDVISNIEATQNYHDGKVLRLIQSSSKRREETIKNYRKALTYMDKMTVCLQKQQAQLLKDSMVLKRMEALIKECICNLEKRIRYGESTLALSEKELLSIKDDSNKREQESWNKRLQRRIEALRISYAVSLQSLEQLRLLQDNNAETIDRIASSVSGTISIWRNQVAFLLGLENIGRKLEDQRKAVQVITTYGKNVTRRFLKSNFRDQAINYQEINRENEKLIRALNELLLAEHRETQMRSAMIHVLEQE